MFNTLIYHICSPKVTTNFSRTIRVKASYERFRLNAVDVTFSPRELSFLGEDEQILIATSIVANELGEKKEMVIAIEHRPQFKKNISSQQPDLP